MIAAALMLLIVLGVSPVAIDSSSSEALITSIVGALLVFAFVAICFAKGRVLHGTIGIFVVPIAIYGAWRIGKPRSAWARYRYGERRPEKQAKAEERFAPERRTERFKEAFRDIVGGKPSEGLAAVGDRGRRGDPRGRRRSPRTGGTARPRSRPAPADRDEGD